LIKQITPIVVSIFAAGVTFGGQFKVAKELRGADPASTVDVIVQFNHVPTLRDHERILSHGGAWKGDPESGKFGAYAIPARSLSRLENDPAVLHVSADHKVHAMLDLTADAVNASAAWASGWTGAGIGVAVIDSGISKHPDLDKRVVYSQDFSGGGMDDYYGHGEHVAGIIGASGKTSECNTCTRLLRGMAPGVNLLDLRVLDQNGEGNDSGVIAAIAKAIELKTRYNVRVINLSLGRPISESYTQDPLCQEVEAAWRAGIVVVVAAGNGGRDNSQETDGYATITAPGNDPYVITVGAMKTMGTPTRSDDLIASYSSKGPTLIDHIVKPDIVAPGNRVVSLLAPPSKFSQTYPANIVAFSYYRNTRQNTASKQFFTLSGTSMATPVVSGAVADLLQSDPNLTPDQVKAKLMLTAYKTFPATSSVVDPATGTIYSSQYDIFTVGAGYLDVQALLNDQNVPEGTALSPTAVYDADSNNVYLVTDQQAVWGTKGVWGTQAVWGTKGVWGTQAVWGTKGVWGTQAVWGTSTMAGFRAVWGKQAVSGMSAKDGSEADPITISGE